MPQSLASWVAFFDFCGADVEEGFDRLFKEDVDFLQGVKAGGVVGHWYGWCSYRSGKNTRIPMQVVITVCFLGDRGGKSKDMVYIER